MKLSDIKIEALKLMFITGAEVLSLDNLEAYAYDENYGFYLVKMNGSINRCFSRLEAMGVLPPRVHTLRAEDARELAEVLEYDLTDIPISELVDVVFVDNSTWLDKSTGLEKSTWQRRKLCADEYEHIPEENLLLLNKIGEEDRYKVYYRPKINRLTDVSGNNTEIDIPDTVASLIPLYIKSELYQEDEPGAAAEARNLFEAQLLEIKDSEERKSEPVRSVYSLADM